MELIQRHIKSHKLPHVEYYKFEHIIRQMISKETNRYKKFLFYIDFLVNENLAKDNLDLVPFHLHFQNQLENNLKDLIAEFLLIKFFHETISDTSKIADSLDAEIQILASKINSFVYPAKKNKDNPLGMTRKMYNAHIRNYEINKARLKFYNRINKKVNPNLLFNTSTRQLNAINGIFELQPYAKEIEKKDIFSTNLINLRYTLNEIDAQFEGVVDSLNTIVLYDCERSGIMANFSYEELHKWNSDYSTSFRKYLVITFGNETESIHNLRKKVEAVKQKFKIPKERSYTILKLETDSLLNKIGKKLPSYHFFGQKTSTFWDIFITESSISELYELKSIRLMNIYSICYTEEIKKIILDDLFSTSVVPELISLSTKIAILELRNDDVQELKKALSNTLDLIIQSDIMGRVNNYLKEKPLVVLDEGIIKINKLFSKLSSLLGIKTYKVKTWSDLDIVEKSNYLILSYRDQGKYPNYFYPNLIETRFFFGTCSNVILPAFLFENNFNWAKYNQLKDYHKCVSHVSREKYFDWRMLDKNIRSTRPELVSNIDWSSENEFSFHNQRNFYKIKIKRKREYTVHGSELFIISDELGLLFNVVRADSLLESTFDDGRVLVQNIDEITKDRINIYEKMVDKKQEEAELSIIRAQFNLGNEAPGRLWKVLLQNKSKSEGIDSLYKELERYFETKGLKMVSKITFNNTWINPDSESVAPLSKKIFLELCNYLDIPKSYFYIIQRMRNASKMQNRNATRKMNYLLKDLFNDGCFDTNKNAREIITNRLEHYKANHPLDDLGIDENYLIDNLATLVELLLPELKLLELETIEKNNNE